jgi:hypothetical protein
MTSCILVTVHAILCIVCAHTRRALVYVHDDHERWLSIVDNAVSSLDQLRLQSCWDCRNIEDRDVLAVDGERIWLWNMTEEATEDPSTWPLRGRCSWTFWCSDDDDEDVAAEPWSWFRCTHASIDSIGYTRDHTRIYIYICISISITVFFVCRQVKFTMVVRGLGLAMFCIRIEHQAPVGSENVTFENVLDPFWTHHVIPRGSRASYIYIYIYIYSQTLISVWVCPQNHSMRAFHRYFVCDFALERSLDLACRNWMLYIYIYIPHNPIYIYIYMILVSGVSLSITYIEYQGWQKALHAGLLDVDPEAIDNIYI